MGIFRRYRFALIMTAFLLGGLTLFSVNAGRDLEGSWLGRLLLEVIGPAQQAMTAVGESVGEVWGRYFALLRAARQNEDLKRQVAFYRQQQTDVEELKLANQRFKKLLALKETSSLPQVAAQVVGTDPTKQFRTVIIDKGLSEGVQSQMPVINAQGVVGRVIWASRNYAKVLLLVDPNAAMDVLVQRSRARGIVEGAGADTLRLKYVLHNDDVAAGDRLVATGADGIFPKGALAGFVRAIKQDGKGVFQQIEVEPAVDFERLEEVVVILQRRDLDE
ncbi:Cell shape-determining protein MreC [Desulfarculales bacterium]